MSEVFNRLRDFVIKQSFVDDEEITRETRIEEDLGVSGDDAVEFMIAYGKMFNVDLTKFMAGEYFESEGGLTWLSPIKKKAKKVLTVGHLEKGILTGRLDDEVINS